MPEYFSNDLVNYKYYQPDKIVNGKTMAEHLRIAICYWHTFGSSGADPFGGPSHKLPWNVGATPLAMAENKLNAAFEFITKLKVPYFTFHDFDLAPEGQDFNESVNNLKHMVDLAQRKMAETKVKLLWGTANLFSHPRYMAGAATNPNPEVFAYAAAQVKHALDATKQLGGSGYVMWGGREGYDSLLNTNMKQELEQFGRFVSMVVEYKHKIGFKGELWIEPKPCEPTRHQYDSTTATVFAFLQKFNLEKEVKVNIEANHATLAGQSFLDEVAYACANNLFGSIDINRGDPQNGWDTDQFPNSVEENSLVMYEILRHGGMQAGGFNFDAKVRRQSINLDDLIYAHVGGIEVLAKSFLIAQKMLADQKLQNVVAKRYKDWQGNLGANILTGRVSLAALEEHVLKNPQGPNPVSGQQEWCENLVNSYLWD